MTTEPNKPPEDEDQDELRGIAAFGTDKHWAAAIKRIHAGHALAAYVRDVAARVMDVLPVVGLVAAAGLVALTAPEPFALVCMYVAVAAMAGRFVMEWVME